MSNSNVLLTQFEADEVRSFSREDWLVIYGLKVSPRCNETKHRDCGGVDFKKWPWCECTCHVPMSEKAKWMREYLPSYKGKA
jgi:hypothetical protein